MTTYRQVFAVGEFRALLGGHALMLTGETVKMLALAVLVYAGTGSPLLAALAYVAGFLPQALGGTLLLSLADRWRPRTVIVGYDLLRLAVGVVLAVGWLSPLAMMLLVFLTGTLAPIAMAARTAVLPDLLEGDRFVLGRSLFTLVSAGMQVAGAAVGGVLLAVAGPDGALWLAAASCVASALVSRFGMRDRPARTSGPGATAGRSAVRETLRVNGILLRDAPMRGLLLAHWAPVTLMVGAEGVVVPYAAGLGREPAAGVILAVGAAGMLIGEFVVGRLLPPHRREQLTPWLALLFGAPLLVFLVRPGVVAAALLLGLATAGMSYHLGLARRFLEAAPEAHRGQAFGLLNTGMMTAQGLTMAGAGALAEFLSPGTVMAVAGVASLIATAALWPRLTPAAALALR
ncbi:MFS transporter [Actinoplanes sp. NBRC 103695]|uniref:MFS transporter n=1 Tax=Actinoplanes sp. NBRC 103695 TaxID=3032202 RepID=UPI0024A42B49|nr:MFS transporter [Actinoplanes sp. NBRC 103695]GLY93427.1 MFS transporter [Actinoplanes sp. NBRC 103695]